MSKIHNNLLAKNILKILAEESFAIFGKFKVIGEYQRHRGQPGFTFFRDRSGARVQKKVGLRYLAPNKPDSYGQN